MQSLWIPDRVELHWEKPVFLDAATLTMCRQLDIRETWLLDWSEAMCLRYCWADWHDEVVPLGGF